MISFNEYLEYRGYETPVTSPLPIIKRGFIDAWFEIGFHRFWRVWNAPFGYVTYNIYRILGGNRVIIFSTLLSFMICGFLLHDIFGVIFEKVIGLQNNLTFLFFGLFTLISRFLEKYISQEIWPTSINFVVNVILIWISFRAGTILNRALLPGGYIQL
jgi:hypothetical protein